MRLFFEDSFTYIFLFFVLPLVVITGAAIIVVVYLDKKRHDAFVNSGILEIDKMDGHKFEEYLKELFDQLGFKATVIGGNGGDFGADVLLTKGDKRYIVQAKRYRKKVGNSAIQQAIAAKTFYKAHKALVITNSTFTHAAWRQAKGGGVSLWDRKRLLKVIQALQAGKDPDSILHESWLVPH